MKLANSLIKEFSDAVNQKEEKKDKEQTVFATVVSRNIDSRVAYVRFDGSDQITPVDLAAEVEEDDRVTVLIKNHKAVINGNLTSSPEARNSYPSLYEKPSIEGVTLLGDKTFDELNLTNITNTELEEMLTL